MDAQTCIKKLGYVGILSFATVDEKGKVVAKKRGKATITASAGNVTVSCLIRVT